MGIRKLKRPVVDETVEHIESLRGLVLGDLFTATTTGALVLSATENQVRNKPYGRRLSQSRT